MNQGTSFEFLYRGDSIDRGFFYILENIYTIHYQRTPENT